MVCEGARKTAWAASSYSPTPAPGLRAMIEHPVLISRPIVVMRKGVKLSRPSEAVLDLLDRRPESFTKEDGEVVQLVLADAHG